MGKREPRAVKKLIADAQARQVERSLLDWLKRLAARDQQRRDTNGGSGTRGQHRR